MSASWSHNGDGLLRLISAKLADSPVSDDFPGLKTLIDDYLAAPSFSRVDFQRRLLRVFRESSRDNTYQDLLAQLHDDERERVEKFVADEEPIEKCSFGFDMDLSLGVREHLKSVAAKGREGKPVHVDGLSNEKMEGWRRFLHVVVHGLREIFHCFHRTVQHEIINKDEVVVYQSNKFENWGLNISNVPAFTCIPSTVAGVQRIVKYAKKNDMSVRCAGFRHSWSPVFGRSGQIIISLLSLHEATQIPNTTALNFLAQSDPTELETIEIVKGKPLKPGNALVRVGCSVTNERLRRWCVENDHYTLPLNVIMVEMTIGGTNGPICHGSGRENPTLSDLVRKIEYVDANGNLNVVDKPEHLRAASGCFGLMGVITHLTLELSPMTYAVMRPTRLPTIRAVPPPPDMDENDIPPALRMNLTPEQRKADQEAFEKHANNDYYNEWFWFPFSDEVWINCWNHTTDRSGVEPFPSEASTFFSFVSQLTINVLQFAPLLHELIDDLGLNEATATLISRAALFALPDEPIKTYLTDALHFQRGIQNVRVRNLEVEMPLLPRADDASKVDYATVQRAWWDAILKCYQHADSSPQRMPLEMRIMGGSDVTMAPQRGNRLGTCAIEILTLHAAREEWKGYAQEVLDKWTSYKDGEGKPLRVRPHWAKEWHDFEVDGQPWPLKLKNETYREEISEFKAIMASIGQEHGWTLKDLKARFSNDFFDSFYFDEV